jgi:DNA-binding NarL/FixJ family response regulator
VLSRDRKGAVTERMPIHVIVADTGPLMSQSLAQALRRDPGIESYPATGSPEQELERCRQIQSCVLLADEAFLERADPVWFRKQVDCGRGIAVLVLGARYDPERVSFWLRLGCLGYISKEDGLDAVRKAVLAVTAGQHWARRGDLARLIRDLIEADERRPALTVREREILERIARGWNNAQISDELCISLETVRWHCRRLFQKLGARSRQCAIEAAHRFWPAWRIGKGRPPARSGSSLPLAAGARAAAAQE